MTRTSLLRWIAAIACVLHATSARSDELCAGLDSARDATRETSSATSATGGGRASCPSDMIEVEGDFCPFLDQTCIRRPQEMSYRCLEYRKPSGQCQTGTARKHFCIDTYEWPNKVGENPVVMKDWYTARNACQSIGKRLCTEDEWTLACEGPEHLPYPYGFERDPTACNIDKPHRTIDEKALSRLDTRAAEVARLWQGEPSGSRERCVSPFGVHDMAGNVDEWTLNETGKPHHSALKGGYWSWVRGRCRPVTPGHDEGFKYYNIGWRCCADAPGGGGAPTGAETVLASAGTETKTPTAAVIATTIATAAPLPAAMASRAPVAGATAIAAAPAPPAPAPTATAPPFKPMTYAGSATKGAIGVPSSARGHRVFVDGKNYGSDPRLVVVDCGARVVKIGHDGRDQPLAVPCGGRVDAAFP